MSLQKYTSGLFALCLLALSSNIYAQNQGQSNGGSYLLEYKPKKGTAGNMKMTLDMNMKMEMMGQEVESKQTMLMDSDLEVYKTDKTTTSTKVNYNHIVFKMENAMIGELTYDSRNVDENSTYAQAIHGSMKSLLDTTIYMEQDRTGKMVSNTSEQDIAAASAGQPGSASINSILNMSQFPTKPINIGESWTSTNTDPSSPMAMKMTYTLHKVENNIATINVDGIVTANKEYEGESNFFELLGTQKGFFKYDVKTMWLLSGELTQNYNMKMQQNGMDIPTKIDNIITIGVD
ncbi:MAG: DUF6263 family protein [Bacteroidia bacterium]